jgi:hypothetical protein
MSDERLDGEDSRLKSGGRTQRAVADSRTDRAMTDRAVTENRELTDAERLEQYRMSHYQAHLPDLPKLPGFHVCWLTTTNPRDSIFMRERQGYTLIKTEEVPGWEHLSMKSGEFPGSIMVNEMVAAKLPLSLYQGYMEISHSEKPRAEEGKLTSMLDVIRGERDSSGKSVVVEEGDGFRALS